MICSQGFPIMLSGRILCGKTQRLVQRLTNKNESHLTKLHRPRKVTSQDHQTLHLPRKVTSQECQIVNLPRKVTSQDHQIVYLGAPNTAAAAKSDEPRSPNIAPATKGDKPTQLLLDGTVAGLSFCLTERILD